MEQNTKSNIMDQSVKMWQMGAALIGLLLTVATMIYNRGTNDTRTINRVEMLERQFTEFKLDQKTQNKETSEKIDRVDAKLNEILIILQNKQDRK